MIARGLFAGRIGLLLLGVAAILLYGGIIFGVLPSAPDISWEGHLAGLVAGVVTGYASAQRPPPPARKRL